MCQLTPHWPKAGRATSQLGLHASRAAVEPGCLLQSWFSAKCRAARPTLRAEMLKLRNGPANRRTCTAQSALLPAWHPGRKIVLASIPSPGLVLWCLSLISSLARHKQCHVSHTDWGLCGLRHRADFPAIIKVCRWQHPKSRSHLVATALPHEL